MKHFQDKIGIILAIGVTSIALITANSFGGQQDSIQSQGEELLDLAESEISDIPEVAQELTEKTVEQADSVSSEVNEIIESDSVSDLVEESSETIQEILPPVPNVIKKSEGELIELISIPPETDTPGCEKTNKCYLPSSSKLNAGGEVIWTNHDTAAHTITSGSPQEGPDGLFDSGLLNPGETYSLEFNIPFEYEYFCLVHPWMQGMIVVE